MVLQLCILAFSHIITFENITYTSILRYVYLELGLYTYPALGSPCSAPRIADHVPLLGAILLKTTFCRSTTRGASPKNLRRSPTASTSRYLYAHIVTVPPLSTCSIDLWWYVGMYEDICWYMRICGDIWGYVGMRIQYQSLTFSMPPDTQIPMSPLSGLSSEGCSAP